MNGVIGEGEGLSISILQPLVANEVGDDHRTAVDFEGQIVRIESRQGLALYGVKLDKVSSDQGSNGGGKE